MQENKHLELLKVKQLQKELEKLKKENLKLKSTIKSQETEITLNKRKIAQLQFQNQKKSEYIGQFSHEFKTPLSAIKGFVSLLADTNLSKEKQIGYYKNILKAAEHLNQIINCNLDIVRAENDKINLRYEKFYPSDIIFEVIFVLEEKIKEKNIIVNLNIKDNVLKADKRRFRQLIYNLICNAYKYNKFNGEINIQTYFYENKFYFEIKDTGCGIDDTKQKEVFEFFSNINTKFYDNTESSGIGLSLCRKIINLHGGDIDFESKKEEGSVFWFYLPVIN